MSSGIYDVFPKELGEAARRSSISHYHLLGLPITSSRDEVIRRVRDFEDHIHKFLRNTKRELGTAIQRDYLDKINTEFSNADHAALYRENVTRQAAALRKALLQFAIEKKLGPGDQKHIGSDVYGLITGEIPQILAAAETQWRLLKKPMSSERSMPLPQTPPSVIWLTAANPLHASRVLGVVTRVISALFTVVRKHPKLTLLAIGIFVLHHYISSEFRPRPMLNAARPSHHVPIHQIVHRAAPSKLASTHTGGHRVAVHPPYTRHPRPLHKHTPSSRKAPSGSHVADDLAKKLDP
jgi:hypothetical protein